MSVEKKIIPVQAGERIQVVDVLRGFAILGILLMNMRGFSGQSFSASDWNEPLDRAIVILIDFFAQAKFYSLFSFLFGWGMAMQLERSQNKGINFIPFYMRRLIILFVFGGIHTIFLWTGDILTMYALLGMVLLILFSKRSENTLLVVFIVSLLSAILMTLPGQTMNEVRVWCRSLTECLQPDELLPRSLYVTGTYLEVTKLRFQEYLGGFWWVPCYFGNVFAMMALGLYVGKRKIFENIQAHIPLIRRTMWIGLTVGLPLNGLFVYSTLHPFSTPYASLIRIGSRTIGAPALTLFYIATIIFIFQSKQGRQHLVPLAYAGRMALSNYIAHSTVVPLIFYGYGLGLYGETDPTFGLILTIIIYLSQIRISQWWFERYQYGPLEWLWRTLAYATQQPFSITSNYDSLKNLSPKEKRQRTLRLIIVFALALAGVVFIANKLIQKPNEELALETQQSGSSFSATAQPENELDAVEPTPFITPFVQPVNIVPGPIAASGDLQALAGTFNAESALGHINVLANDFYQGRYAGSPTGHAAGSYIADQFARYGLQPVGDNGGYFQAFPITPLQLSESPSLNITHQDGRTNNNYQPYKDFKPVVKVYAGAGAGEGDVVWVVDCTSQDFHLIDTAGKVVLCRNGDIFRVSRLAAENGAAGLLLLTDPAEQTPEYQDAPLPSWIPEPIPVYYVYPKVVQDLLEGNGYSIPDLSIVFEPFDLKTRVRMEVKVDNPCGTESCVGRNVLGMIPGRDPAYADQIIIIGASYDGGGEAVGGTILPGANDNASGVAVLLEIARSWQEQAYVPAVATLFIAWDAGEQESLGAQYYVQNPKYLLEKTVTVIDLDKMGAGGEKIQVDGYEINSQIIMLAEHFGIDVTQTTELTGNHYLFSENDVQAFRLSWEDNNKFSHTSKDTPTIIQMEQLQTAGQFADLLLLSMAEGNTRVNELLARRAEAVMNNDLSGFLETSTPKQKSNDELWFKDAQTLNPISCEFVANQVRVAGNSIHAFVTIQLEVSTDVDGETKTLTAELPIVLQHNENGWQWDGPDLLQTETAYFGQSRFTVHYPSGPSEIFANLGQLAAEEYTQIATALSLSPSVEADIYIYPKSEYLASDTSPVQNLNLDEWITQNTIKLTYSPAIFEVEALRPILAQLALANAGIPRESFPWLWEGFPYVMESQSDQISTQLQMLPKLQAAFSNSNDIQPSAETSWAAVDYLRQKFGWNGLGRFITNLGRACQNYDCTTQAGMDQALTATININSEALNTAWQYYWKTKIVNAQGGLDEAINKRVTAVVEKNETAFLQTVDQHVPNLLTEEKSWFGDLSTYPTENFVLTTRLLAFLDDGSVLALVNMDYKLENITETWGRASLPLPILFSPSGNNYRWAGPMMQTLSGNHIHVRYPAGQEELVQTLLANAEIYYAQLSEAMNISNPQRITIDLYDDKYSYRSSVALSFPAHEWTNGWSAPGHSIKLLISDDEDAASYQPALVELLSRQLLYQTGIEDDWLITGASAYLSRNIANGDLQRKAAEYLSTLNRAIKDGTEFDLNDFPSPYRLSEDEYKVATAQAWDSVRFLASTYGQDTLLNLIKTRSNYPDLDAALRSTTGLTTLDFASAWKDSFASGHISPTTIETSLAFDEIQAQAHIDYLISPLLAGRQAGSPGSEMAATYIAENFATAGLLVGQQTFEVGYQTWLQTPALTLRLDDNDSTTTFTYRDDFLVLQSVDTNGLLSAELVWVADEKYTNMDLDGKIAIRKPSLSIKEEIANAKQHGAGGLILIGDKNRTSDLYANFPVTSKTSEDDIPVLELTRSGVNHLLELTGQTQEDLYYGLPAVFLNAKAEVKLTLSEFKVSETSNIFGLLPGTDPDLQNEYIVVGAHYDHVGDEVNTPYRGANDNASGIAVLLETARLWQESGYRPKRSVVFIAWGGQEKGELGSHYFVENPIYPLENIIATIQLDSVGGGGGYYLEAQGAREMEGLLLFSIQKASELTSGRLQVARPEIPDRSEQNEPFSADTIYHISDMFVSSDDIPFRQAGIPTLLMRWQKVSEKNLPDEFADEVLPERLAATGRMVSAMLMMLAQ